MKYVHRMREGESVEDVAMRYGVTAYDILRENNISRENVKKGLLIVVSLHDGERYVVRPYDTIASIAKRYGVSADDIRSHNDIDCVFLGEVIYIPRDSM